ncbi:MAG: hypothetical protein GY868_06910 [Deltaproteobacteria bacterium]|nr:hypothetical protein [Deltaproteobacteria bacterium]
MVIQNAPVDQADVCLLDPPQQFIPIASGRRMTKQGKIEKLVIPAQAGIQMLLFFYKKSLTGVS